MDLTFYNKNTIIEQPIEEDQQTNDKPSYHPIQFKGITLKQYFHQSYANKTQQVYKIINQQSSADLYQNKIKIKKTSRNKLNSRTYRNKTDMSQQQYQEATSLPQNSLKPLKLHRFHKKVTINTPKFEQNTSSQFLVKNSINLYSKLNKLCKKTSHSYQEKLIKRRQSLLKSHQSIKINQSPKFCFIKSQKINMQSFVCNKTPIQMNKDQKLLQIMKKNNSFSIKDNLIYLKPSQK